MTSLSLPITADTTGRAPNEQAKARREADSGWLQFDAQLGPVAVRLMTNCTRVYADYATVNHDVQTTGESAGFRTTVVVEKRRSWRSGIVHYHIKSEVEERFTVRKRARVVPHIDGMINLSVARHLPDFVQLHAAVLQRSDVGLVIPGGPGFGKTTLTAALIKRGWNYASDEFALIDPRTVELAPFPKSLSIKPGSVELLEREGIELTTLPRFHRVDKGAIRCLPATHIRRDALADRVTPRMIVFPNLESTAEPTIREIPRGLAAMHCLRRCFNFARWGPAAMETVAQLCEQCSCYELTTGNLAKTCELIDTSADEAAREPIGNAKQTTLATPQIDAARNSTEIVTAH